MPFTAPLIDLSKLRPGDEVTVRARVTEVRIRDDLVDCVTDDGEPDGFCIRPAAITAWNTRASPPPSGGEWVMVPREPSGEMLAAGEKSTRHATHLKARERLVRRYRAMIAAAPTLGKEGQ